MAGPDLRDTSRGQFPTVEIAGRLFYLDYHNKPHPSQREAIEANAGIEIAAGRNPCQRGLDIPGFIPNPFNPPRR